VGLDAFVPCSCHEEGRASPPPFPIVWDEETGSFEPLLDALPGAAEYASLDQWADAACEHPGMRLADERISNWAGYRTFQGALARLGWNNFPALERELPNSNQGHTPPAASQECLRELQVFASLLPRLEVTVLEDAASGAALREYVPAYGGAFLFTKDWTIGFDTRGFFVRAYGAAEDNFRAMQFEQVPLRGDGGLPIGALYRNLITGAQAIGPLIASGRGVPLSGEGRDGGRSYHPQVLRVSQRPASAEQYGSVVRSLEIVFRASVKTGNPVYWC
jgi:hypothetical protein